MAKDRQLQVIGKYLMWVLLAIETFWMLNLTSLYYAPNVTAQSVPRPHFVATTLFIESEVYRGIAYTEEEAIEHAISAAEEHILYMFGCMALLLIALLVRNRLPFTRDICWVSSLILFAFVLLIM